MYENDNIKPVKPSQIHVLFEAFAHTLRLDYKTLLLELQKPHPTFDSQNSARIAIITSTLMIRGF